MKFMEQPSRQPQTAIPKEKKGYFCTAEINIIAG